MATATKPESTAVAVHSAPIEAAPSALESSFGQVIKKHRELLEPFLRDGLTLERVAAELVLASRKTPNLDKCPAPLLVDAISRALQTGGTIGEDVYLVPFKNTKKEIYEPTVMLSYRFKAELVVLAGGARSIDTRPVFSDEPFEITYGSTPSVKHSPSMRPEAGRQLIGAYAVAFLGFNHAPKVHWISLAEVEVIRKRSKEWNPDKVPVCPPWYACVRAVHQLVKLLPKNPRLAKLYAVMEFEERAEFEEPANTKATVAIASKRDISGLVEDEMEPFPSASTPPQMGAVERVDESHARALRYIVPGGDHKDKQLGDIPIGDVRVLSDWALRQQDKKGCPEWMTEFEEACNTVLELHESKKRSGAPF